LGGDYQTEIYVWRRQESVAEKEKLLEKEDHLLRKKAGLSHRALTSYKGPDGQGGK